MGTLVAVVRVVLAVLSLRRVRWAYVLFIVLGLAYFPARVGFRLAPRACEVVFGTRLALFSLTNFPHILLFGLFFVISCGQFRAARWSEGSVLARSAVMTLIMGALVELAEGLTGRGNCRLRDLIPDSAGIVLGTITVALWDGARPKIIARIPKRFLANP
jgi:hypothetical protein